LGEQFPLGEWDYVLVLTENFKKQLPMVEMIFP
jgi:hypothetical protein